MALFRLGIPSLLLFFLPFVATTCYHPDGTAVTDPAFQPCSSSSGTISMCCGTNRTESPDECLPNGLCHNPCATSGQCGDSSGGQYWRESCTDSSWRSPFCLQGACTNSPDGGLASSDNAMSQCAIDGSWCCGGDLTSDTCCGISNRVVLAATIGASTVNSVSTKGGQTASPVSTFSSMSTAASSTGILYTSSPMSTAASTIGILYTSSPMSATSSTTPSTSGSLATSNSPSITGVSIGVGIGIGISGLVIAAIVAFFLFRRRKLRASKIQAQHQEIMGHEVQDLYNSAYDNGIREQHGRVNGHEIPYGLGKPELDGLDRRKPRSNTKYYELPTPP